MQHIWLLANPEKGLSGTFSMTGNPALPSMARCSRDLLWFCIMASAAFCVPTQTTLAQTSLGEPLYGTESLSGGFTPDPFVISLEAGGSDNAATLSSACTGFITAEQPDFRINYTPSEYQLGIFVTALVDTTLIINTPDGAWHCNDDFESLDSSNPGIVFSPTQSGQYDIWVGTYDPEDIGASIRLFVTEQRESQWLSLDSGVTSTDTLQTATRESISATPGERGRLETGDETLAGYGYADRFTFSGVTGQNVIVDLRSDEFDTYLEVQTPSGEHMTNDDYDGSTNRSLLSLTLTESGDYEVTASSFMSDETGVYTLNVDLEDGAPIASGPRVEGGLLESGDEVLGTGEYVDIFEIEGRPGQNLLVDLTSNDFDTYLILQAPSGEQEENDDADNTSHSVIDSSLTELGMYRVLVTSYGPGSSGSYTLSLDQNEVSSSEQRETRDIVALTLGRATTGNLDDDDLISDDGVWEDSFSFAGTVGETVQLTLTSADFDTYLRLVTPNGETIENDDFEGNIDRSVIALTLQESGRYRVIATAYSAGDTGEYQLALNYQQNEILADNGSGDGQIYGIFAGISDYPGSDSDLSYTDQDAVRTRDALINGAGMRPENAITLLNSEATIGNMRDAIERIASRANAEDTFVLFYSGHGSRVERPDGPDSTDPDGIDETIELYDGSVLDDDLNDMLSRMQTGTTLLVLDSCFSGGFAKDVISKPGRMGLFSSEEDVTSQVAAKFRAGGYLSVFFEEALDGYADMNKDGELTALELSEYLHDRFRNDVKSFGLDQYVRTGGPQSGYQHLVVDRGGIGPYNTLFNHR